MAGEPSKKKQTTPKKVTKQIDSKKHSKKNVTIKNSTVGGDEKV